MADHENQHHDEEGGHGPVPGWLIGVIGLVVIFFFSYIFMYLRTPENSPTGF